MLQCLSKSHQSDNLGLHKNHGTATDMGVAMEKFKQNTNKTLWARFMSTQTLFWH